MIKVYDKEDNIVIDSVHNAEMISAYLRNVAVDYESYLSDEQYGCLCRCSDLLWVFKQNFGKD